MKLGRLIHSYQKFEKLLKRVIAHSNVFGEGDEFAENLRKFQTATSGQTLGSLTTRLFDTIYGPSKEIPEPAHIDQSFTSFEMRIVIEDSQLLDKQRTRFQKVVEDRNTLIHSTLDTFNADSESDCQVLIDELDRQGEQLIPLYEEIQRLLKNSVDYMQAIAANPELFDHNSEKPDAIQIGDLTFTRDSR